MYKKPATPPPSDVADQRALLEMFRSIPVSKLRETAMSLLDATRTGRTSKAMKPGPDGIDRPDTIQEPENQVRLRTFEVIVTQRAGAAPSRKPVEQPLDQAEEKPGPWLLRKPGMVPAGPPPV